MGLLNIDAPKITNDYGNSMLPVLVYFDLETDGFAKTAEILQIAAKCNNYEFSVYITPTKKIDAKASEITGLQFHSGCLYYHGETLSLCLFTKLYLNFINFCAN